jgi:hypothetical protein
VAGIGSLTFLHVTYVKRIIKKNPKAHFDGDAASIELCDAEEFKATAWKEWTPQRLCNLLCVQTPE